MIPGYEQLSDLTPHVNNKLRTLFEKGMPILKAVFTTAPTTDELPSGSACIFDDGTSRRFYFNIDGTIYYTPFGALSDLVSAGDNMTVSVSGDIITLSSTHTSNSLWSFGLTDSSTIVEDTNYIPEVGDTPKTYYWQQAGNSYVVGIRTKFKKLTGVDTITHYHYVAGKHNLNNYDNFVRVTVGGQSSEASTTSNRTTRQWINNTIDVSSLTDGTVYDVTIELKNENGIGVIAMYYSMAFGS